MTEQELRYVIGQNIREERMARKMSTDELAEQLGLSPGFLGLIERGQRGTTAFVLLKMSDVFGIPIDSLFFGNKSDSKKAKHISRREKIMSFTSDLSDCELEYVVKAIKGLIRFARERKVEDAAEAEAKVGVLNAD